MAGFAWIDCHNYDESTLSYIRKARDPNDTGWCAQLTPVQRVASRRRAGDGFYRDFQPDSSYYGGSNVGNFPGCQGRSPAHGRSYSIQLQMPLLGVVVLKPQRRRGLWV